MGNAVQRTFHALDQLIDLFDHLVEQSPQFVEFIAGMRHVDTGVQFAGLDRRHGANQIAKGQQRSAGQQHPAARGQVGSARRVKAAGRTNAAARGRSRGRQLRAARRISGMETAKKLSLKRVKIAERSSVLMPT